jgi:hypothetical protein
VKPYYGDRLAKTITAVAGALGLSETDVKTQLYDAIWSDTWIDESYTKENLDTANGKVFLTYNPDIFKDGKTAAYQVWAGAQVNNVDGVMQKQSNSAIKAPFMSVSPTPRPSLPAPRTQLIPSLHNLRCVFC